MKKIIAVISLVVATCSQQTFAHTDKNTQLINETMKSFMQQYQIPGAAIAIVDHGKSSIYVYGYADREAKKPISKETIFEVGSITKLLTTLLIAEEIKLNLTLMLLLIKRALHMVFVRILL